MTDYIEEMMRIAGVKPKYYYDMMLQDTIKPEEKFPLKGCSAIEVISYCKDKKDYGFCKVYEVLIVFPDFTPAKQLEIIKLIGDKCHTLDIFKGFLKDSVYHIGAIEEWGEYKYNGENQDFTQALAQLTIELMKANELDKKKVKEILER